MMTYLEVEESTEHNPISNSETGAKELQEKKIALRDNKNEEEDEMAQCFLKWVFKTS